MILALEFLGQKLSFATSLGSVAFLLIDWSSFEGLNFALSEGFVVKGAKNGRGCSEAIIKDIDLSIK